jgi:antirestriction protein ArdC
MTTRSRQDIHAEITNKLIKAIEANPGDAVMPWRKSGKPLWLPQNALTRKRYNGINIVSLWVAAETTGYAEPLWATYRQWVRRVSRMKGVTDGSMSSVQLCRHFPRAAPATALCEAGMKA